jgi:hypothetical protein
VYQHGWSLLLLLRGLPLWLLLQAAAGDAASAGMLTWRTPLAASRPHWEGWYRGLSDTFLSLPVPKMLLLAGTDR